MSDRTASVERDLIAWVHAANPTADLTSLTVRTPLIEERVLTSLQVTDLLLFIERRRNRPIDIEELQPGSFRSIEVIVHRFFEEAGS